MGAGSLRTNFKFSRRIYDSVLKMNYLWSNLHANARSAGNGLQASKEYETPMSKTPAIRGQNFRHTGG